MQSVCVILKEGCSKWDVMSQSMASPVGQLILQGCLPTMLLDF